MAVVPVGNLIACSCCLVTACCSDFDRTLSSLRQLLLLDSRTSNLKLQLLLLLLLFRLLQQPPAAPSEAGVSLLNKTALICDKPVCVNALLVLLVLLLLCMLLVLALNVEGSPRRSATDQAHLAPDLKSCIARSYRP